MTGSSINAIRHAFFGLLALYIPLIHAKTDLDGCVSSETVAYGGASLIWYVPDTGEICAFLDCGGGRAPPKTTVPGCPAYEGTSTYSPSYLRVATPPPTVTELNSMSSTATAVTTMTITTAPSSSENEFSTNESATSSMNFPTAIPSGNQSLVSTKTETDLRRTTVLTGTVSIPSTTGGVGTTSSSTAGGVLPTWRAENLLGGLFGVILGLRAL